MSLRFPSHIFRRTFTKSTATRSAIVPPHFAYSAPMANAASNVPKLGRIGRWYLPTMALIAVGMIYQSTKHLFINPLASATATGPLDRANRQIGFAIANALNEGNRKSTNELSQHERNRMLLDAYGARSTLEDMEQALNLMEKERVVDQAERNRRLEAAYGHKTSLKDVRRAMEVYEVQ